MKARLTMKSRNRKTGPIPVSTTERASCPLHCPLHREHNPDAVCRIDGQAVGELVRANDGRRGFTFTHHILDRPSMTSDQHRAQEHNASVCRLATEAGFVVNLSANSPTGADWLAQYGCPVVTLTTDEAPTQRTPGGRKIVRCPAEYREGVTCATCGLCQRADRGVIVGFTPHGAQKKAAASVAGGEAGGRGGCYGNGGKTFIVWNDSERYHDWSDFCKLVADLPDGQLWRHNQAGDLPVLES